ncbi:MAG TPA: transglutaminase-like domain-containing protein [Thermodesulfobacteriota bacterium]|nr:transglutaminase-like domain-containing protein [Thermodesulfobacteriota bacterium]
MDSQRKQTGTGRLKTKCLCILLLFPVACGIIFVRSFDETVSGWRSYKDVERWMEKDFSLDTRRFKRFEGTLPPPRTPEETFKLKSGIYIDAAIFAKEVLNRIDPSYQAQIVVLFIGRGANHYVCSLKKDGKIFIMDYGTPYKTMIGVHGPFSSLEEYRLFFEKNHPTIKNVQAITYLR